MDHIYDMIIIGGGPAGYTAALYAARAGIDAVLLERLAAGGQMCLTGEIENYPGFNESIDGFTLGMKMKQGAERFGAKTEFTEVSSVDFSDKIKKIIASEKTYLGKTVIVATGANPRRLGIKCEDELIGKGVHYCAHCDGGFYRNKTVVVVGGGNSAAADALYLSELAEKVYLVHRRDKLRAEKIYHEPLMNADNLEFVYNSTVSGFISDGRIKGVTVRDVNTGAVRNIACDGVFVSIGRKPASEFLSEQVELDDKGYIIADETTRTNISGVFAAGDVRTKALRQIVTAAADGATAVHFAQEYLSVNQQIN